MAIKTLKPVSGVVPPTIVSDAEQPEDTGASNALQLFGSDALFAVSESESAVNLYVQAKIPSPVELGAKFPSTMVNKFILFDGVAPQIVPVPYTITAIAGRASSREEVLEDPTNPKSKKKYRRAYIGGATNQMYLDQVEKARAKVPGFFEGNSYIVAIISASGIVVAELAAFKTQKDYWGQHLKYARVQQGAGTQVLVEDHTQNAVVSPTSGYQYLSPKKFNQVKPVELTREQLEAVSAVFSASKAKFDAWMKQ